MSGIQDLYETLQQRKRPEDVAQMVLELLSEVLSPAQQKILDKAAARSLKRLQHHYTSMMESFAEVKGAAKQMRKAGEIFQLTAPAIEPAYNDPQAISAFIQKVSPIILKDPGKNNFSQDRLNKTDRTDLGLDISKRNYNKKWRLLKRLDEKLEIVTREIAKLEFQKMGKHGLAGLLSYDEFSKDLDTACLIAYLVSRGNLRSEFTIAGQQRVFDEIADMLLKRCEHKQAETNWYALSHVYSSQEVLQHLTDEKKGTLLGMWTSVLQEVAAFLEDLWWKSNFNRETMIVRKGNDSSSWNNAASAWNKARDNWINFLYALGLESVLDDICFGKVMRLMAGDVAYWHRATGGKLDPNTEVWNHLPLPWDVFNKTTVCTRAMVEEQCKKAGIDPQQSGWLAPRKTGVAAFKPTPELVHGVTVSSPFLATILKKHKYYSGKNANPLNPELN